MKPAALALIGIGAALLIGSFFVPTTVAPDPDQEQAAAIEQAVTDLHGAAVASAENPRAKEEAKVKAEEATKKLQAAREEAEAQVASRQRIASIVKVIGILATLAGGGWFLYLANQG